MSTRSLIMQLKQQVNLLLSAASTIPRLVQLPCYIVAVSNRAISRTLVRSLMCYKYSEVFATGY